MTALNKQALRLTAEKAKDNFMPNFMVPTRDVLALLDELEAAEKRIAEHNFENRLLANADRDIKALRQRIAELEANKCKPVMFIDGDISPADADKLAAVIREFNEETETPAARMARIIRENPHTTNMCDMPAAGIGVKEE